jgi:hypothetical protein
MLWQDRVPWEWLDMEPTSVAKSEPVLIDLDAPESWPVELLSFLDAHHDLFLDWETGPEAFDAKAYDEAVYALSDVLVPYARGMALHPAHE